MHEIVADDDEIFSAATYAFVRRLRSSRRGSTPPSSSRPCVADT